MDFNKLEEITMTEIKRELDKKHVEVVLKQAEESGYTVDFDVEVGTDGDSTDYVTLNLNYINPDGEYIESDEVLAVETIPANEVNKVDQIEEIMQDIGQEILSKNN